MNFTTESWDENNGHHKNSEHNSYSYSTFFTLSLCHFLSTAPRLPFHLSYRCCHIQGGVNIYYSCPTPAIFILRALRTIISINRLGDNQQIPSSLASFHPCRELRGLAGSLDTQRAVLLVLFLTDSGDSLDFFVFRIFHVTDAIISVLFVFFSNESGAMNLLFVVSIGVNAG